MLSVWAFGNAIGKLENPIVGPVIVAPPVIATLIFAILPDDTIIPRFADSFIGAVKLDDVNDVLLYIIVDTELPVETSFPEVLDGENVNVPNDVIAADIFNVNAKWLI